MTAAVGQTPALSDQGREVLRPIAYRHTNQRLADRLCISAKSVETYKARLMQELRLAGQAVLVRSTLQQGLLKETDNHSFRILDVGFRISKCSGDRSSQFT